MQSSTCYVCQKQGHWAKNCPDKGMKKPMPSDGRTTFITDQAIPDKQCPHCGKTCLVRLSHTEKNPGRMFYKCPEPVCNKNFFQWCDSASPYQIRNIPQSSKPNLVSSDRGLESLQSPYPECSCGAGICNLFTSNTEGNKGRKYFGCPVKKGQGACNFFQWQDSAGTAGNGNHVDEVESFNTPTLKYDTIEWKKVTRDDNNGIMSPGNR